MEGGGGVPKDMYPVKATRRYRPTAVPIDVAMTPFISFSSRISFAIVKTYVKI
jgi:hypothetical protein